MGRNWPLEVFKVFFKQNSIFTLLLDNFLENRKNRFFAIFHLWVTQNVSIEYSTGPEHMIEYSPGLQNDHISCRKKERKKMAPLQLTQSLRSPHFVVWPGFPQNTHISSKLLKSLN